MASKKQPATATRTRVVVAKPTKKPTARRKKKADVIDDGLAAGVGYVAPDVFPALPVLGPWLAAHPQVPVSVVAAGVLYVAGQLAGGKWARSGKYAALGAVGNYLLRRAGEPKTAGLAGAEDRELLNARELFEQIDRQLPPAEPEHQPARVRRIGELKGR